MGDGLLAVDDVAVVSDACCPIVLVRVLLRIEREFGLLALRKEIVLRLVSAVAADPGNFYFDYDHSCCSTKKDTLLACLRSD